MPLGPDRQASGKLAICKELDQGRLCVPFLMVTAYCAQALCTLFLIMQLLKREREMSKASFRKFRQVQASLLPAGGRLLGFCLSSLGSSKPGWLVLLLHRLLNILTIIPNWPH